MPLSAGDALLVEEWYGPMDGDERDVADAIFDGYSGSGRTYAKVVALRMLRRKLGQFTKEVADIASASDRANHSRNFQEVKEQLSNVLRSIASETSLPAELQDDVADASSTGSLVPIGKVTAPHRRVS